MSFPLTAAAAQVETFETLNEGMWVTPAAIQNIENVLAANAATSADVAAGAEASHQARNEAVLALATANETITTREARITELEARVAELESDSGAGFQSTTREADNTGGQEKVPYHLSNENPMNALADSLPGLHKKK